MIIKINPLDTFFFRDGKPFTLGEETWADDVFPPSPSVLYGALRTTYATHNHISVESIEKETESLEINKIYYKAKGSFCVPMPLDLAELKEKGKTEKNKEKREKLLYQVEKLKVIDKPKGLVSNSEPNLTKLLLNENTKEPEGCIIEKSKFIGYLKGKISETKIRKITDYLKKESKIGIGRDDTTHATEESKLYRVGMNRADGLLIFVDFKEIPGLSFPNNGLLKFGGEGKVASFQKDESNFNLNIQLSPKSPNQFKLYLSTPAIFEQGWYPDLTKKGIEATLITACTGKPLSIGGFDMKGKNGKPEPKPMYKAVKAGSVYYYETEEKPQKIIDTLHEQSVSDIYDKQGFGIAYIGNV